MKEIRQAEKPRSRRRIGRIAALVVVVVLLITALLFWAAWIPLRRSREAWRGGNSAAAIGTAEAWSVMPLWQSQFRQLIAAEYLTVGNRTAAAPYLAKLRGTSIWFPAVRKDEVARRLFARGRYDDFLAFDAATSELREPAAVALDRAAALTALNRLADADAMMGTVRRDDVDPKALAAVEQALTARKSGAYPLIFDRTGHALASYQIANADLVTIDKQFEPLIDKRAGGMTIGGNLRQLGANDSIDTTLDPEIQRAALAALGGFRGSLVAIDPRTNEILAIASNAGTGPMANLAIEQQYEPGSVVKVLTGLDALDGGADVKSMFPYDCKGDLVIDGRHFADWVPAGHGPLPSINEALAVSCNIVFGDLGSRIGGDRLRRFMTAAGFDGEANLVVFRAPLGRILPPIVNRYETARAAIGLEHESATALHLAMIASMMANRGVLTTPRLLRGRRSILGEVVVPPAPQPSARIASDAAAATMIAAMKAVVSDPNGTGKRAAIEGLSVAMKTGTAGPREKGLNSLIMAFAPAEQPKIAFGMIAEDAGPAEFAGAKIARDFLEAIVPRLK